MKKRLLSLLLVIVMVLSLVPTVVLAGEIPSAVAYVTTTGETPAPVGDGDADNDGDGSVDAGYYSSLKAAFEACPKDGTQATIMMLKSDRLYGDATTNAGWKIKKGQDIVLDLNGYKLCLYVTASCASHVIEINSGAKLTLEDNSEAQTGLVYNTITDDVQPGDWWLQDPATGARLGNYETNIITNNGTFVMNSGRLQNNANGGTICYALCSKPGSDTFIHGGKIDGTYGSATVRLYHSGSGAVNFTMDGGSIGTEARPAYTGISAQLPEDNTQANGTYTISGGEFIGDGCWEPYTRQDGTTGRDYGFAIYSANFSGIENASGVTWNISGGSFRNFGIVLYPTGGETVNISGGRFNKLADSTYGLFYNFTGITGGYFSEDVSTQVADNLYCVKNTDTTDQFSDDGEGVDVTAATTGLKFSIGTEAPDVCKIISADGKTKETYKSFNAALLAVKTDETIVLLDDCEATANYYLGYGADYPSYASSYNASYGFTVDLNGYTLDASKSSFYPYSYDFAYLTFTNSDTNNEAVLNLAGYAINMSADMCVDSYYDDAPFELKFENITVNENADYAIYLGTKYSFNGDRQTLLTLNNAKLIAADGVRYPNYFRYGVEVNCVDGSYNSIELEDETGLCLFINSGYYNDPIQITGGGDLEISGGAYGVYSYGGIEITGTGKVDIHDVTYGLENWGYDGYPDIITNSNPNLFVDADGAPIYCAYAAYGNVSAGYYSADVTDFCKTGYVCLFNTDETTKEGYPFVVKPEEEMTEEDYVASVTVGSTTTKYPTMIAAINAVTDGCTVTLLKDTQLTGEYTYVGDKDFTLDFDGHTLTNNDSLYGIYAEGCNITLKDGTLTGASKGYYVVGGSLTLDNATIVSTNDTYAVALDANATLNAVEDSINAVKNEADNGDAIMAYASSTISGKGTIIAEGKQSAVHAYGVAGYPAVLTVTNPNLIATNTSTGRNADRALYLSIEKGSGTTVKATLYAGVYENDVEAQCAEGYGIVKLTKGLDGNETLYKDYYQVSQRSLKLNQEPVTVKQGESGEPDTYKLGEQEITVDAGSGEGAVDPEKVIEQLNEMLDNDTVAKYMNTDVEKATSPNTNDIKEALKGEVKNTDDTDDGVTIKDNIDTATDISKKVEVDLTCATVQEFETIAEETTSLTTVTQTEWEVKPVATVTVTNSEGDSVTYKAVIPNDAINSPIGFCLPVNKNVQATSAELFHQSVNENGEKVGEKESCGIQPIKTDANGKKYIEYAASEFSFYSIVTMTNVSASAFAVIKTEDADGNISYDGYDTLQAAVTAYTAPETGTKEIILLKDVEENVDFDFKTLTLDLNSYVFKGESTNAASVTVKNTVVEGDSVITLAATGVYANNVKAFVMDGYDARTSDPAVGTATLNEVFSNNATDVFTVKVVTSTDIDRDTTNDETEKNVDVFAGDTVHAEVRIYGARSVAAKVALKYDGDNLTINEYPSGWTDEDGDGTIEFYDANTDGITYWELDKTDSEGKPYYLLGEFDFTVDDVEESYITEHKTGVDANNNPVLKDMFEIVGDTYVAGAWKEGWSSNPANKVADEKTIDDWANIRLKQMSVVVTPSTGLVYKNANLYLFQNKDMEGVEKDFTATDKNTLAEVTGAEIVYAVTAKGAEAPAASAYSNQYPTKKDAGDYTVHYKVTKPGYVTVTGQENVSIAKRDATLTWSAAGFNAGSITKTAENESFWTESDFNRAYNGAVFSAPTAKYVNADGVNTDVPTANITMTTPAGGTLQAVGSYVYTATINDNYNVLNPTCTLLIDGGQIEGYELTNTDEGPNVFVDKQQHDVAELDKAENATPATVKYYLSSDDGKTYGGALDEMPKVTEVGKYAVKVVIRADGYYDQEQIVKFEIKRVEFFTEKTEYVVGWKLILVYTNETVPGFTYDGHYMYDVSTLGYKYLEQKNDTGTETLVEGTEYTHVYAILVKGAGDETLVVPSNDPDMTHTIYPEKGVPSTLNRNDTNENGSCDINDLIAVQAVYNVDTERYLNDAQMHIALKADVTGNKVVDMSDYQRIKTNS